MAKIPKSVDDGMLLRIREKGHEALNGVPGDLILGISIFPDKEYKREGSNILSEKKITVSQAILGGVCDVETVDGTKQIKYHPGVEHN